MSNRFRARGVFVVICFKTMYNKAIIRFGFCDIRNNQGLGQPRPQGFSLKKWVGREKALASAGHESPRTP